MNKKNSRFAPIGLAISGVAFLSIVGVLLIRAFEATGLYTPADSGLLDRIMYAGIAVFVAGLLFDWFYKGKVKTKLLTDSEQLSDFMSSLIWCVFGFLAGVLIFTQLSWPIVLFSLASLTFVRMVPVFLVLTATELTNKDKMTIAWFGPRGMASIVFTLMVYQSDIENKKIIKEFQN